MKNKLDYLIEETGVELSDLADIPQEEPEEVMVYGETTSTEIE